MKCGTSAAVAVLPGQAAGGKGASHGQSRPTAAMTNPTTTTIRPAESSEASPCSCYRSIGNAHGATFISGLGQHLVGDLAP